VWNWERWNSPEFGELEAKAKLELTPKRHEMYVRCRTDGGVGSYVFLTHEATGLGYRDAIQPALMRTARDLYRFKPPAEVGKKASASPVRPPGGQRQDSECLRLCLRRVGLAVVITATALIILISMIQLIPGDPAAVLLGPRATPEMREAYRVEMGLDQPALIQILRFFRRVLGGDLGTDVITNRPVLVTVLEQLPFTLTLIVTSIGWAALLGIPLGCWSAIRRGSLADHLIGVLAVGTIALPSFVVAIYGLLLFSVTLGWFPTIGAGDPGDPLDRLHHLVLPSLAVGLGWVAISPAWFGPPCSRYWARTTSAWRALSACPSAPSRSAMRCQSPSSRPWFCSALVSAT